MKLPVTKVTLDNGLRVLLKEIHTSPIISHWVWYQVGSRDETSGTTGVTHWVEHMLFKGTELFPTNYLDRAIAREGGMWNAFTYLDWTTYFETMPAEKIDLALQLEADRMAKGLFKPEEVDSERTVIISERQGSENDPLFLLSEEVQSTAFRVHPYHHEIIGDMADLHNISRNDLFNHYQIYYTPNNSVLAAAGDFDTGQMLDRIRELFEPIPSGPEPKRLSRPEPPQKGERTVTVEGPGETTYIQLAYHAPAAANPDFFSFTVLDSLLTGPSNLNLFGGGISNKTSRLYRALVDQELAVSVAGGLAATIDPFLYTITFTLHPKSTAEQAIAQVDAQIGILQENPPDLQELHRAVKQARALFAYGSESISNQAFWMGFTQMFSSYEWFTEYLDRLSAITPEEVQRIARSYLRRQNRVLGIYRPAEPSPYEAEGLPEEGPL